MIEQLLASVEVGSYAISLFAVAVIVIGFVRSLGRYVLRFSGLEPEQNFHRLKIELAMALTLGLEILVVADIIETITVEQTFGSLAVLAILVIVRTVLSWTVSLSAEGHWPWQEPKEGQVGA